MTRSNLNGTKSIEGAAMNLIHLERGLALMFVLSVIVLFFVHGSSVLKLVAATVLVVAPLTIMLGRIIAFVVKDR